MTELQGQRNREAVRRYRATHKEEALAYRESRREGAREYACEYRRTHPAKLRRYARTWEAANSEKRRAAGKQWREANPEKMRVYAERWRLANPERARIARQAWLDAHPEATSAFNARRRARKSAAPGNGVSLAEWRVVLKQHTGRCAYCAQAAKLSMDHLDPLSRGGAHDIANVLPACTACNSSKMNKSLVVWLCHLTQQRAAP